ncbi:HAD-IIA family hydrolase [Candidatus Viridilinea mediisalina]|uniref:HAD family hydrolase n=1 Tax=Candidatus Viridilinea mediisalina TaxID=2024553 RepID=A0A2A6RMX2_9CHLR|nr:HAD-IIA family hydrolase [Candidatus Viridilinea mediisalina]PDW04387.1 HAD family hydrolase [Candidatus Viridilinea mediisalina]
MPIPRYAGYSFDLDGTIYLGDQLLPAAAMVLTQLRTEGRRIAFLSNNPTRTRAQYVAKLRGLGLHAELEEVINSSYVMVEWLRNHAPGAPLFVCGEAPLIGELQAAGFQMSERPGEIAFVVASFDRTFSYRKLQIAFDAIRAGARLVATNPDRFCPVPGGGEPDAAAIIAAIEACTNVRCEVNVGKPSPMMAQSISTMLQLPPTACLMVGDRLMTDIAMGATAGMDTLLVLTGDSSRADLATAPHQPTYVAESLAELVV